MTTTTPATAKHGSLLQHVRSSLFVAARRRSRSLLEGEYASIFHGRSIDYDDLREYEPGDEVRDIDWKATARHGSPLVRRYVAARKQNIMFVLDTGRGLGALADGGEPKREVALAVCGLIGHLAQRHGDLVGLVHGSAEHTQARSLRGSRAHLEMLLREVAATGDEGGASELTTQLEWVARTVRRRLVLLVVADEQDLPERFEPLLKRLHVQHEILWVTLRDADPTAIGPGHEVIDVGDDYALPEQVRLDPTVVTQYRDEVARRRERTDALMRQHGIVHARIGGTGEVLTEVFSLLHRQRRAR